MQAYLCSITKLSSQELLSTDIIDYFNHIEWNEGGILHYYSSVIFIQRSHTLLTKTITYTLYGTATQKAIAVYALNPNSGKYKLLKEKSMQKVLSCINTTFCSSEPIQPVSQAIEEVATGKVNLPNNIGISDQLEEIELSTKFTHPESPQTAIATSSTCAYLKNIPNQTVRKFNKLLKILMICAVSLVLLNLVINILLFRSLQTFIEEIDDGTQIVGVLARQRNSLSLAVFYSKQLLLYDLGVTFDLDRPRIKSRLSNLYESLIEDLKEIHEYDQGSAPVQKLSEVEIVWYEYYGDHYELDYKNLISIQERIISLISKFNDIDEVTVDNPYLIEMYRNGYAEVMDSLNHTVVNFKHAYEGMLYDSVDLYQSGLLSLFCLLAILQGLGLAYIFYILNRERVKIWSIIANVPKEVIDTMLARLRERIMIKYHDDLGEVSSKSSHNDLRYKHLNGQKSLYFFTALFYMFSLVSIPYIYSDLLPRAHTSIRNKLKLNEWTGQQQTYLYMSAFLTRECGYHLDLIKDEDYYEEPKIKLYKTLDSLEFAHKKAFEGMNLSSNITDIYLGNFNSTHYFEKGLHPKVYDIVSTYRIMCDQYETDLEAGRLYDINNTPYRKQLESQCDEVIGEIDNAFEERLDDILADLNAVIVLMLIEMVFIIITAMITWTVNVRDIFEKEAHFLNFIPFEVSI